MIRLQRETCISILIGLAAIVSAFLLLTFVQHVQTLQENNDALIEQQKEIEASILYQPRYVLNYAAVFETAYGKEFLQDVLKLREDAPVQVPQDKENMQAILTYCQLLATEVASLGELSYPNLLR